MKNQVCLMTAIAAALVSVQAANTESAPSAQNVHSLGRVLGAAAMNSQGEKLGEFNDLVFDGQSGRLSLAIISVSGDGAQKLVAAPADALEWRPGKAPILNADPASLRDAPAFEKDGVELNQVSWGAVAPATDADAVRAEVAGLIQQNQRALKLDRALSEVDGFQVEIQNNQLVINGTVPSAEAKRQAEKQIAESLGSDRFVTRLQILDKSR